MWDTTLMDGLEDRFHIRLLEASDVGEFLRLRLEALQNDPAAFGSSWEEERTQTPESIAPRLRPVPNGNFLVGAFNGPRLIGMAGFLRRESLKTRHKGSIWGVYVTSGERGAGVGRALLLSLLERARGYDGLEQITLSVAVPQKSARHLYASLGFEVYGYERHALKIGESYVDEEHRMLQIKPFPAESG